jgi:hypothetical protein
MAWWFLILAFSAGAVLWAGISAYLRVRGHLKATAALKKSAIEHGPDSVYDGPPANQVGNSNG